MAQTLEAVFMHSDRMLRIDYVAPAAIACGQVVDASAQGLGLAAVCTSPEGIASGALGSLAIDGVFRFLKDGTSGPVFNVGDAIHWDASANLAVKAASATDLGDMRLGVCIKAAGTNEDGVWGLLNGPVPSSVTTTTT